MLKKQMRSTKSIAFKRGESKLVNQGVAERISGACDLIAFAGIQTMLKLQTLHLLGNRHQDEQVEGERLAAGHLLGTVAQGLGQMQNHILKFPTSRGHDRSLRDR